MKRPASERVGVLIVGAGPTGLTLAIDLARRGVVCHVVEAAERRTVNPRCNTTSARSMEIFRRLGLSGDIRRTGLPEDYPTSIQYRTSMRGEEIFRIDLPSAGEVLAGAGKDRWPTPEPQHRISQLFLEPVLERHAKSLPGLTLERGTRLTGLRQDEDQVEAVVESTAGTRVLHCDYVVGCDGAHSAVRRHLGIRYQGVDAIRKFVSTFVRSPELGRLAARDRAWTYWTYGRHRVHHRDRRARPVAQPRGLRSRPRHGGRGPRTASPGGGRRLRRARGARRRALDWPPASWPSGTTREGCSWPGTPRTSGSPSADSA